MCQKATGEAEENVSQRNRRGEGNVSQGNRRGEENVSQRNRIGGGECVTTQQKRRVLFHSHVTSGNNAG